MRPGKTSGNGAQVLAGGLLAAVVLLSGALAWLALRRERVIVVPGVRESQVLLPEEIPDAAAIKFAHLYLSYFDDYSPETVEERSTFVLRQVSPELGASVRRDLSERAVYVVRTRESSQLLLAPPGLAPGSPEVERLAGGLLRVLASGERRTFISSELKARNQVRYALTLRPRLPTDRDAFGFEVVGQTIRAESDQEPDAGKRVRHD